MPSSLPPARPRVIVIGCGFGGLRFSGWAAWAYWTFQRHARVLVERPTAATPPGPSTGPGLSG